MCIPSLPGGWELMYANALHFCAQLNAKAQKKASVL